MSSVKDLILFQKIYDFMIYSFPIINRFPKNQKYVLGQQIQNQAIDLAKLIMQANKFGDKHRLTNLYYADVELEKLRMLLRLATDLGMMSYEKYGNHAEKLVEIGKLLGGWIKQQKGV
jgi:four helix bundle protein